MKYQRQGDDAGAQNDGGGAEEAQHKELSVGYHVLVYVAAMGVCISPPMGRLAIMVRMRWRWRNKNEAPRRCECSHLFLIRHRETIDSFDS